MLASHETRETFDRNDHPQTRSMWRGGRGRATAIRPHGEDQSPLQPPQCVLQSPPQLHCARLLP